MNDGRAAVGEFMETIGYSLNAAHNVFAKADAASIRKSGKTKRHRNQGPSKEGKKFYGYGGVDE